MANTYAINTVRGKEFEVEAELQALGLHPWVARRLDSKKITQQKERVWFDKPYVSKLVFCAFHAVYWRDVVAIKNVIGKPTEMNRLSMTGSPAYVLDTPRGPKQIPKRHGLIDFKDAVEAEYADAQRKQANNLYQCAYTPGQALEVLSGQFEGFPVSFQKALQHAHKDYARLVVELDILGANRTVEMDPDHLRAL